MNTKQIFKPLACLLLVVIAAVFITAYAYAAPTTAIVVSTNKDEILNDGECSLREAIIAANLNAASGAAAGECPAGSNTNTDVITLQGGTIYILSRAGTGEDGGMIGDLDIIDNMAALDVQFVTDDNNIATIDGDDIDRVLHVQMAATVEINNLELTNGLTTGMGGNLLNDKGIVTLNDSTISSGEADQGGGIYVTSEGFADGRLILNNTLVTQNEAVLGGLGGGVYALEGKVTMTGGTISLNTAAEGGGIYAANTILTISDALLQSNAAILDDGGGIYLADAMTQDNFSLQNSMLETNTAASSGGGLYAVLDPMAGTIHIENNTFLGNQALQSSGAIYALRAHIRGGMFVDNLAVANGGALGIISLVITDTLLTGNATGGTGGAMFVQRLTATNIRVENNQANNTGGGIYAFGNSGKTIFNSVIISNTAGVNAGGIYQRNNSTQSIPMVISKTVVANNHAVSDGGGIWVANKTGLIISNSTISSNRADNSGGGFYIDETGVVTATNITIALNLIGQDVYKLGDLTLQNSIIFTPDTPNCTTGLSNPLINSLGNNISDDSSCLGLTEPTDQIVAGVGIGPLADNGGDTLTHALLAGSPAIDAGNNAACATAVVGNIDQRGAMRAGGASYGGATCDIGAYEHNSIPTAIALKTANLAKQAVWLPLYLTGLLVSVSVWMLRRKYR